MKKIISLILILVLTIGVAPFSAKADTTNYIYDYEQFEVQAENLYANFDFYVGNKGVATARLNLKQSYMSNKKTYYIYANYESGKGQEVYSMVTSFEYNGQDFVDLPLNYGVFYKLGISDVEYTGDAEIKDYFYHLFGAVTKLDIPTVQEVGDKLCDRVSQMDVKSQLIDRINLSYSCDTKQAIYVDGKYVGDHKRGGYDQIEYYIDKANGKKLIPGSKHTVKIWPYATVNGVNFMGSAVSRTVTVAPFTATGKPSVTKLNKKMVSVYFDSPIPQRKAGLSTFYIYAGNKKVKTVQNKGEANYQLTIKKKGIAKKKIKIVAKCTSTNQMKSSNVAKAQKNVRNWKQVKNVRAYSGLQGYVRVTKVYYSGNKLMMKGFYVNGHILKLKKFKVKLRIRVNGKIVAKKNVTVKKMKGNSIKNFKVIMKKGKYYDLRNGSVLWGYDVLADVV